MGKHKDPWVLGMSASHNGAVCLLKGDQIVVAIQEERLSRQKRHRLYGAQQSLSLDYCFDYAGITPRDLSMIVITVQGRANSPNQDLSLNPFLRIEENGIPTCSISHHFAHAVSAFATSGFQESAVLVVDGIGSPAEDFSDEEATSIKNPCGDAWEIISLYSAAGTGVRPLEKHVAEGRSWLTPGRTSMPRFRSLGGIFSAAAVQIFGGDLEAGKVMGLAPYGEPTYPVSEFFEIKDGSFLFSDAIPDKFQHTDRWPKREHEYINLASSAQQALEYALLYLVEHLYEMAPSMNLCYAGGVALNSVANERIIREAKFKNVYIIPAAEDSGPAIGAAYYGLWKLTGENTKRRLLHDAVGREYSTSDIRRAIAETPAVEFVESSDPISDAVDLLIDGKILGWFQGRSELGPRALGQRSIICDPRRPDGKEVLNSRVKHREAFRPFAPVVLLEEAAAWFDLDETNPASEFMLRVCPFKKDRAELVPAVVHVDGTGRIQTATKEANGPFYTLIKKFGEKTGVPIILNTSFNIMGMPIIETPLDALLCLLSTGLDYCVLGNSIVKKRECILLGLDSAPSQSLTPGTRPSNSPPGMQSKRSLDDYAGEYGNATGVLIIKADGDTLEGTYNRQTTALSRSGHDSFEASGENFKGYKVSFIPDKVGFFGRAVVDPGDGSEIVFTREPQVKAISKKFMRQCAGEYDFGGKRLIVKYSPGSFTITAAGQPDYHLIAQEDVFNLKNTPGYSVQFIADDGGAVSGAIVTQPNGVFYLERVR
ncbi:MAG TPA: carbamoyltransferase C-terminal domain-containing protein [Blastocatellia bacterium]|nr:carbamoyltransferase C-terminal domain-containing protein [Blastocatellia bacterium]